jgi:hypothetical protein
MAAAARSVDTDDATTRQLLTRSDPLGPKQLYDYTNKVEEIKAKLKEFFPSASLVTYTYVTQLKDKIRRTEDDLKYGA